MWFLSGRSVLVLGRGTSSGVLKMLSDFVSVGFVQQRKMLKHDTFNVFIYVCIYLCIQVYIFVFSYLFILPIGLLLDCYWTAVGESRFTRELKSRISFEIFKLTSCGLFLHHRLPLAVLLCANLSLGIQGFIILPAMGGLVDPHRGQ